MNSKSLAQATMQILADGYYDYQGRRVDIAGAQQAAVANSQLIPPEAQLTPAGFGPGQPKVAVAACSTVAALLALAAEGVSCPGLLNFASAKNPGGGFLNGATAQEESLAAASGLYPTLLAHPEYYQRNRECGSMVYTDYAIYSPGVVFFREDSGRLLPQPVKANVLTLPAVNFGQVRQKGEDPQRAKAAMKQRMRRALEIFAHQGDKVLILGAFGCGVFRNDPADVARWWQELLAEGFGGCYQRIVHAIYDRSPGQACLAAFRASLSK